MHWLQAVAPGLMSKQARPFLPPREEKVVKPMPAPQAAAGDAAGGAPEEKKILGYSAFSEWRQGGLRSRPLRGRAPLDLAMQPPCRLSAPIINII